MVRNSLFKGVGMKEAKTYPEGTPFPGKIGRTIAASESAWPQPPRAKPGSPNILVVLFDDVGFAHLGCFGSDINTPNINRLATGGLRYRDFHTTAICAPTRACLLTGRNHHTNGLGIIPELAAGFPGYNGMLPKECGMLPEILVNHGYATFAIGKWHLVPTSEYASGAAKARWPLSRGFERYYGFLGGKTNQWAPTLVHDNQYVNPPKTPEEGYHLNADLADRAIEYLGDLRTLSPEKPFFMYYCLGAGHSPHHVEPEWIERYKGKFDKGWDQWREEVYQRQLAQGIIPPGTQLTPRPEEMKAWESLPDNAKKLYARQMEVYAAFLEQTDHHLGRVIDFIDSLGELDNTIVMLASDNGASAEGGEHGTFNECLYPNRVEPGIEDNLKYLDDWGSVRSYPNYSWGWAWAGNTPLKRWKRYLHQGGMSDPLVVHWPKGIKATGEVRNQYVHVVDITPTLLDVLGIEAPKTLNGAAQKPMEGVSFAHTLNAPEAPTKKTAQYYEMLGSRAIWSDGWKAVAEQPQGVELTEEKLASMKWELYHVAEDFSESVDLAEKYPERLQALIDLWWSEAGKYNVLPLDSRMQARMSERKPSAGPVRNKYIYYPGGAPHFEYTAVNVKNRSHTITAEVEIPESGAAGVLLAHGSYFSGYAFYVKEQRLVYVHNYLGLSEYRIVSEREIPPGKHRLEFRFTRTGEHCGKGALFIDGQAVGEGEIPRTIPAVIETSGEGLCCGYDGGLPVTHDYQSPFYFSGKISRVVVEVEAAERQEAELLVRSALVDQ